MRLKEINVKVPVKFSWLKYVTGSNLEQHCAKSLLGTYEQRWQRYGNPTAHDLDLPESPFYYFCAVTPNYRTNVHVAWRKKEGALMVVETELVHLVIEDAEQLPITNANIYRSLPQSADWHFNTCRNWWFASWLHSIGK